MSAHDSRDTLIVSDKQDIQFHERVTRLNYRCARKDHRTIGREFGFKFEPASLALERIREPRRELPISLMPELKNFKVYFGKVYRAGSHDLEPLSRNTPARIAATMRSVELEIPLDAVVLTGATDVATLTGAAVVVTGALTGAVHVTE